MPDETKDNSTASEKPGNEPASRIGYTPPPSPGRAQRAISTGRRWARDTFSREQLVAAAKQLFWVAPLTLLIWVYADRAQRFTQPNVPLTLEVYSTDRKVHVQLIEPSEGSAAVDLTASRTQVDKLRRDLGPHNPIRFEIPADRRVGDHQFPLSFILGRDSRFDGIVVSNASPRNAIIRVDTYVEKTIPIEVRKEDKELFEEIQLNPPAVKLRLPSKLLEGLERSGTALTAYADLSAIDRTPGSRKTDISGVRVVVDNAPSANQGFSMEPLTTSVSLTVSQPNVEYMTDLPVQVAGPPVVLNNQKVDINPAVLRDVVIVGPSEVINQFRSNRSVGDKVGAYVTIVDGDQRAGVTLSKEVRFSTPANVTVKSIGLAPEVIPITAEQPVKVDVTITSGGEIP